MSHAQPRISGPLLWATLSGLGTQLVGFITFVLLARLLGAGTFGLVSLAALLVDVLQVVSVSGVSDAVIQRKVLSEEDADTAFWTNLLVHLALFALVVLSAPALANLYGQPDLLLLVPALASIFLISPLGAIHTARLTRELRFRALALRNMVAALSGAAVGLPLAFADYGAWALVAQRLTTAVAMVIVVWFAFPYRPRLRFSTQAFRGLGSLGGWLAAAGLVNQLIVRAPEYLSGLFFSPRAIGFIRSGSRMVEVLQQLTMIPFAQVSLPLQARAQGDPLARQRTYAELSRLSAFMMFPVFFGCAALSVPIVSAVFGPGWGPAATAILILGLGAIPNQMDSLVLSALAANGHGRANLIWTALQLPVTLLLVWWSIPYGWEGMLAAYVVRAYLMLPVGLLILRHHTGISMRLVLRSILPAAISAVTMFAVIYGAVQELAGAFSPLLLLPAGSLAGAAIYFGLYWLLDRAFLKRLRGLIRARLSDRGLTTTAIKAEINIVRPF